MRKQIATMRKITGKSFKGKELPAFTWNADLVYFDGPFISLFKSDRDEDALFIWMDCDSRKNRWCIVQIARDTLREYLSGSIPLLDVISRAGDLYFYDMGASGKRSNFVVAQLANVPTEYLPRPDSYLDLEYATEAANQLAHEKTSLCEFHVDGDLYLEDVSSLTKTINQLYSFHYGLTYGHRTAVRNKLSEIMSSWRGGINAVNIFSGLRSVIPSIHRPKINRLQYASPGFIELDALPHLAKHIEQSILNISTAKEFENIQNLYNDVYVYFKKEKLSGFDDHSSSRASNLSAAQASQLELFCDAFFNAFHWNAHKTTFTNLDNSPLSRLRVLLAYYRRARKVVYMMNAGKVKI
ncbi:hypothetical protein [Stenotrophomonas maltophilia]|uniref:hypothetical protein n=1 Tax=Stenotrophomonas maltophilia TaxID=40324 RepID=UPI0039F700A7